MGGDRDERRGPPRGDREGGYRRRFDGPNDSRSAPQKEGGAPGEFKPELYVPLTRS